ncbi:MAG: carbon starvation protein A [Spirochaetaceae bacterium]|jgi:carbon starvation protein CstA|nr:carbon starvation protein A [Spirochaetaceae bacterium]GMO21808.1 MAG: carbon starvation protein A [Termitinemataceae bacterium]
MISFLIGIAALVVGYIVYGKISERVFGINNNAQTPAVRINDGVDYVVIPTWRAVLIQFLNIAGTGPIFGAIAGALWGPAAFAWIVFGCIFAGAVHDYFCGMLSLRNNGTTIAEIVGKYLGNIPRYIMRVFSVVLLIFVGVVFVYTPAQVLNTLIDPDNTTIFTIALVAIMIYYCLATILPIDKIIGKIYPVFGAALLIMGVGITLMLFIKGEAANIPEFSFSNMHPKGTQLFPFLFISIACGAVSGFHATQSPLMARCIRTEGDGRKVFYGAMILEGVVAMIWAAAAMAHFGNLDGLAAAGSAATVVTKVSIDLMSAVGGVLAVLGVVACPITSGDTAFRSARLAIADAIKYEQKPLKNRFVIAIPLFVIGIILVMWSQKSAANFGVIWRYFAWSNQALATIALWAESAYLAKTGKKYWITLIPATFMTVVVTSYILTAKEGFGQWLGAYYSQCVIAGIVVAVALFGIFIPAIAIKQKGTLSE